MKRIIIAAAILTLAAFSAGCKNQSSTAAQSDSVQYSSSSSYAVSSEPEQQSNEASQPSEISDISAEETSALPYGVREYKDGLLEYISTSGKLTATFPEALCVENKDYVPKDGIYLQTEDGKQTLQLETVESEGIDRNSLVDYLEETYPDAKVYITDSRLVICKMTTKDKSGNKVCAYMKAKVSDTGYNEAVLYFHQEDSRQSENIFNKISLL